MGEVDLRWALTQFRSSDRRREICLYNDYYDGKQRVAFATNAFKTKFGQVFQGYSENMCAGIVDALSDRLEITGFKSSEAVTTIEDVQDPAVQVAQSVSGVQMPTRKRVVINDPLGEAALEIWRQNNMEMKSTEVHTEALKAGDGYVIVWPDENMYPALWPQLSLQCSVQYDPNTPGKTIRGTKLWFDDLEGYWRLNVYLQDRIEKYISAKKNDLSMSFEKTNEWKIFETVPNPYMTVPVFHFPNKVEGKPGTSELKDVISIQDGLNKSDIDMLVAMEFASYKQRYVVGIDPEIDEETGQPKDPGVRNYGADRMMSIPGTKDEIAVGQFDATDLGQFLRVQDKFWASGSRVSGTPLHYFFITTGDFPSGEAMKSAEARFVKRIRDRQTAFGTVWEKVMLFALRIEQAGVPDDLRMEPQWVSSSPRSESEIADTAVKKKAVGVSRSQILKEMGYDDETIQRMLEETDAFQMAQAAMKMPGESTSGAQNGTGGNTQNEGSGTQGVRR